MTVPTTTLIDARWPGLSGTSTFTRALLQGLSELDPPGRWLLWGPPEMVDPVRWRAAVRVPTTVPAVAWFGQRSALRVPPADMVIHPHQTRPVHRFPAATCVLDLIQLQHPVASIRAAKSLRLRASVRAARVLFTISSSVRDELTSTYGVESSSVTVLELPVDQRSAERVAARRSVRPSDRFIISIGRFTPHKNHPRLVAAFCRTRFAATGGELHLVGGTAGTLTLDGQRLPPGVRVLGPLDQSELEDALASSTALVQASLVEGFGLPVAEALAAGVPVVSSPVPAVTEFGPRGVPTFDPNSVHSIAEAIDATVDQVDKGTYWDHVDRVAWLTTRPTPRTLAQQVLDALERVSPGRGPDHERGRLR